MCQWTNFFKRIEYWLGSVVEFLSAWRKLLQCLDHIDRKSLVLGVNGTREFCLWNDLPNHLGLGTSLAPGNYYLHNRTVCCAQYFLETSLSFYEYFKPVKLEISRNLCQSSHVRIKAEVVKTRIATTVARRLFPLSKCFLQDTLLPWLFLPLFWAK